jgi:hypothetical protein
MEYMKKNERDSTSARHKVRRVDVKFMHYSKMRCECAHSWRKNPTIYCNTMNEITAIDNMQGALGA